MLETEFRTERAVMEALLPRLSIQPLVENAVTYSMEECIDGCMIVVKAERAGEDVLITVENTGSEIDEGILEKLKSGEARARGHGIGLLSIDERTKLLFGQKYGLRFKSQPDLTSVSLLIPFTTKESGACDDEDDSG
jgi:two-component system sensor histidine kinase YesM